MLKAPVLVQSLKLIKIQLSLYMDWWPPGNTKSCSTCALHFRHYFSRKESLKYYVHSPRGLLLLLLLLSFNLQSKYHLLQVMLLRAPGYQIKTLKINNCEIIWFPEGCFELADRTIKNIWKLKSSFSFSFFSSSKILWNNFDEKK